MQTIVRFSVSPYRSSTVKNALLLRSSVPHNSNPNAFARVCKPHEGSERVPIDWGGCGVHPSEAPGHRSENKKPLQIRNS